MIYSKLQSTESLRKWPPAIAIDRLCVKDYDIENSNGHKHTIKKGDVIMVPVVAFHHDPALFKNPYQFDPERFSDENKQNIQPFTYMPFGLGPRNCIGKCVCL